MDLDPSLFLLGLPLVFALGWLASRFDLRQLRMENRRSPKAYFKGLNYLLNEQQDRAIDAFIEAVRNDPDTSELHFALGNLFRRRGEYERAVRVHEHLLSRGDLSTPDRQRAQHALALDFLKAGLLDRAENALRKLENTPFESQARLARLSIYERSREWPEATEVAHQLEASGDASFTGRRAHYLCEQAAEHLGKNETDAAAALLQQAIQIAPDSARARLELARLEHARGHHAEAWKSLVELMTHTPHAAPLASAAMVRVSLDADRAAEALRLLERIYDQSPSIDVLDACVTLRSALGTAAPDANQGYIQHLEREPSLIAATRWIAGEKSAREWCPPQVQRALDHAVKPLTRYRCAACGFEAREHFWHCPGCQAWDSYPPRRVEEL